MGDANFDGNVDLLDVDAFIEVMLAGFYSESLDFYYDCRIDLLDVPGFIDAIINWPGH